MNTQNLEEIYTSSLLNKLENKTFKISEIINLVNIIGNDFIDIVSNKLGLKNFTMSQSETMNIYTFTIISDEVKKAVVIVSTEKINETEIKVLDILTTLFI